MFVLKIVSCPPFPCRVDERTRLGAITRFSSSLLSISVYIVLPSGEPFLEFIFCFFFSVSTNLSFLSVCSFIFCLSACGFSLSLNTLFLFPTQPRSHLLLVHTSLLPRPLSDCHAFKPPVVDKSIHLASQTRRFAESKQPWRLAFEGGESVEGIGAKRPPNTQYVMSQSQPTRLTAWRRNVMEPVAQVANQSSPVGKKRLNCPCSLWLILSWSTSMQRVLHAPCMAFSVINTHVFVLFNSK